MVDNNYTHILAIVDRSGSMITSAERMTDALNEFFEGQAEVEGKCLVDYVQFDTQYEKVFEDRQVAEARALIEPRGATALLDAIGKGTNELGRKLRNLPEAHRPGKVLVVVITDGMENASREFSADAVKKMIRKQEDSYSWEYLFLGANIDAVRVGDMFGFKHDNSLTFNIASDEAVLATASSLSNYATTYRGGAKGSFSDEERAAANK